MWISFVIYVILLLSLCVLIVMYALFCIFCFHRANWHSSAWMRFFRAFSSVLRQMPGYNWQRRGTARPHSSQLIVICVLLFFVSFYVLFVCKCVLYYCHRVSTQLQLTNIYIYIYIYIYIHTHTHTHTCRVSREECKKISGACSLC
jgi:apolipoprotein N-acyltransferase